MVEYKDGAEAVEAVTPQIISDGSGGLMYPVQVRSGSVVATAGIYTNGDGEPSAAITMIGDAADFLSAESQPGVEKIGLSSANVGAVGGRGARNLVGALKAAVAVIERQLALLDAGALPTDPNDTYESAVQRELEFLVDAKAKEGAPA